MLKYALLGITAAGLVLLITPWTRILALRLPAVATPVGHRTHQGCVPSLGGLAILTAFLGTLCLWQLVDSLCFSVSPRYLRGWLWVLAGAVVVTATGAVDDIRGLTPLQKLAPQSLAGVMVLASGCGLTVVTDPFTGSSWQLGWLATPLTLLWVVGITNAFNLIDGLDGLATGVALIASATVWATSLMLGRLDVAPLAVVLTGASAGFLYYNHYPASIFLGDSGSLLLGYVLSILSIQAAQPGTAGVVSLVPLLILGLPIGDMLLAVARRLRRAARMVHADAGRQAYHFLLVGPVAVVSPDQEHLHHWLLALGLTPWRVVLVLYSMCVVLSLMALLTLSTEGLVHAALLAVLGCIMSVGIYKLG
jgi:UDP-GlcNAc:undecaprenyl-phosphate/decaprenyl-phosphate GlcNAc-1-phosphate transferase